MFPTAAPHPFLTEEHEIYRSQLRRFVQKECDRHIEAWEQAGELLRS